MTELNIVKVAMADLQVTKEPGYVLKTTGLGSCVGVTLYDSYRKIAGMAHVMLPDCEIARNNPINTAKYANTAIPEMVRLMIKLGASLHRLEAKLAGGAQMFTFAAQSDTMRIGPRNVEMCKIKLAEFQIPIVAEDTGGNYGRTIEFFNDSGKLFIRSVQQGSKDI